MNKKIVFILLAVMTVGFVPGASALVIGTPASPGTGNCFPFGCGTTPNPYQQVYGASNFAGPIAISSLSFYHTVFDNGNNNPNLGTFTFSLSTTTAAVDGLDLVTLTNNLGADNTVVFSGSLPAPVPFGTQMDFNLSTIFNYSPALGNLLLNVSATGLSQPSGSMFFDMNNSTVDQMSRSVPDGPSIGLVTGFNEAGSISVPEPTTLLLLGLGLAGLGFARKRLH